MSCRHVAGHGDFSCFQTIRVKPRVAEPAQLWPPLRSVDWARSEMTKGVSWSPIARTGHVNEEQREAVQVRKGEVALMIPAARHVHRQVGYR